MQRSLSDVSRIVHGYLLHELPTTRAYHSCPGAFLKSKVTILYVEPARDADGEYISVIVPAETHVHAHRRDFQSVPVLFYVETK